MIIASEETRRMPICQKHNFQGAICWHCEHEKIKAAAIKSDEAKEYWQKQFSQPVQSGVGAEEILKKFPLVMGEYLHRDLAIRAMQEYAASGMRWVKASERLPEINGDVIWRTIGVTNKVNVGYKAAFGFYLQSGQTKDYSKIEWLCELPK